MVQSCPYSFPSTLNTRLTVRTIAIGDIHGCFKAVSSLVEAIAPTKDDLLVFLGDYIDRGPDSRGTVDLLIDLQSKFRTVFIKGNHELLFEDAVVREQDPTLWFHNGGRMTLTTYGGKIASIPEKHRRFLVETVPYHETDGNIFVHANYLPHVPIHECPPEIMYWEHIYDRLPGPHVSGKTVWIGHSPQMNGWIADYQHLICIDTFCFGGRYLTAVDVDSRQIWQTDRNGMVRGNRSPLVQAYRGAHRMVTNFFKREG